MGTSFSSSRAVALWLFVCLGCIALMVALGGITRLTESGLSITEWKPISGIIPPLNAEAWDQAFTLYQQSPQYTKLTYGMGLEEFKFIYWMEFFHRLVGRVAGLVFFLPWCFFVVRRTLSPARAAWLFCLFSLGGVQGIIGWWMVRSGLIDRPMVSPYWLMTHLLTAFFIFALIAWQAWSFHYGIAEKTSAFSKRAVILKRALLVFIAVLFIQIGMGALVAGWDAGLLFNTFPLMEGQWVPDGVGVLEPWYRNIGENPTAIQWIHRVIAACVGVGCVIIFMLARDENVPALIRKFSVFLLVGVGLQIALGGFVVVHYVPVWAASMHQLMALVLFTFSLWLLHRLQNSR